MQEKIATREQLVNVIGNLTLLTSALNPSLGNENFGEKKIQLANSLPVLNRKIAAREEWNEDVMRQRGADLAKLTTEIWPASLSRSNSLTARRAAQS